MPLTEPEYPQEIYNLRKDPEFREFLALFKEEEGNVKGFKENIECLGAKRTSILIYYT
jgi:hypothetical protein